ncbi:TPA: hypothetical protein SL372_001595 [Pseudomonas aeruginosa]|nr:hypothetical protein [Pseudomonas aeruginosa]
MNSRILHSDRDLYFLCRNEPKPDNEKWGTVLCESDTHGKAVSAYYSPFDAMVDALFDTDSIGRYRAVHSTSFDLSDFIADHDNQLALSFQVAWGANKDRILLRPSGKFAACAITSRSSINEDGHVVHLPTPSLANQLHLRLLAVSGIDDWHSSIDEFNSLLLHEREEVVTNAVRQIQGTCSDSGGCDQLALYDLSARKWKFAPYSLFEDLLKNYRI